MQAKHYLLLLTSFLWLSCQTVNVPSATDRKDIDEPASKNGELDCYRSLLKRTHGNTVMISWKNALDFPSQHTLSIINDSQQGSVLLALTDEWGRAFKLRDDQGEHGKFPCKTGRPDEYCFWYIAPAYGDPRLEVQVRHQAGLYKLTRLKQLDSRQRSSFQRASLVPYFSKFDLRKADLEERLAQLKEKYGQKAWERYQRCLSKE